MISLPLERQKIFLRDIRFYLYVALGLITLLTFASLGLTWFGTNAQINISTTLTYAGRERSLTQKLLAETLQVVYVKDPKALHNLKVDEADWTARHDAIWRGDNGLHVLSISSFPDIQPAINKSEAFYLNLHIAVDDVLAKKNDGIADAAIVSADAPPFYNTMEEYNTYLRNLTTRYQNSILLYAICSTIAILLVLGFGSVVIFRPMFRKLNGNITAIAQANEQLQTQKKETEALLEEVRRNDHETRVPVIKIADGKYAVQNGTNGYYSVNKVNGLYQCPCPIYAHNRFCNHIKYVQYAERSQPYSVSQNLLH